MDVDENQAQPCKYSRVGNGSTRNTDHSNKLVVQEGGGGGEGVVVEQYPDDEDQDGEIRRFGVVGSVGCETGTVAAKLRGWHNSSRIYRVSRASGGKDRHSKVLTSKGLRDRRVRLSVSTAIAFYDLQDRLGYDQPSKAVEWLIKAADEAIAELPLLNSPFSDTPPDQLSDGKRESTEQGGFDSADVELDGEYPNHHNQQQRQLSLSKSACSSTSETSKGSSLSLSRSDARVNRVKARERARERSAKEKENESRISHLPNNNNNNHISQNSSFTELLTGGISSVSNNNNTSSTSASAQQSPGGGAGDDGPSLFHKSERQWPPSTPMNYFNTGLLGSSRTTHHSNSGFSSGQIQLGNSHLPQSMIVPPFAVAGDNHHHHPPELQHFSFVPDHLIQVAASQPGVNENYNLNFTMSSSGLAGFNRGTLQSNSSVPSLMPRLPRFSPIDGSSNVPFSIGAAAAASPLENNNHHHHHHYHQFGPGFDSRLQLYHSDGTRHSDQKGKGKN